MAAESANDNDNVANSPQNGRNWGKIILLSGLALLLLWIGLKTWRITSASYALWQLKNEAQQMRADGLNSIDPDEAEQMVLDARSNFLTLQTETEFLMPITPYLGFVPTVGPLLLNAPQLMEMGDAGTETAAYAIRGLKPALPILQAEAEGTDSRIPQLINTIATARPDLLQAEVGLERVAQAYAQLQRKEDFPAQVQPLFPLVDELLPLAQDGLQFAQVIPQFVGNDAPQTYLILAQNDDELRATGGFITGVGVLVVDNGRIQQLTFNDAILVDDWVGKPYEFPPQPYYDYMGLELFAFRDANYWPDFPTSAEQAIQLYSYGQDIDPAQFNGVIAIDQPFMELLLGGTGPIIIPATGQELTQENIIQSFRDSWNKAEGETNAQWFATRKSFLPTFATALRQRLEGDFSQIDPITLARNMYTAVNSKRLQIYTRNPEVMAVLEELDWDGRLENPVNQDFLAIIDSNMGYNKANTLITRQTNYEINLASDTPQATVTINYNHLGDASDDDCSQDIADEYAVAANYEEIANQCYFNYLRVYAPSGATLTNSTPHTVPTGVMLDGRIRNTSAQTTPEFNDFTTFGTFFMLPRAQSLSSQMEYQLPPSVVQATANGQAYRLLLFKQAGTPAEPVTVTITLPPNTTFISASIPPSNIDDQTITITLNLSADTLLELFYK